MNAICLPSGVNRGEFSVLSPPINSFDGADPSAGTDQMSAFLRPLSNAVVVRVNITCLPSGEIRGAETRFAVIKSSFVIGRIVCENEANGKTMVRVTTSMLRIRRLPVLQQVSTRQ